VYLHNSHQGTVCCVHCRTKTSLTLVHHQAHHGSKALQVRCLSCRQFFCSIFEHRRHHRTQSAFPGKLFLYHVPNERDMITGTSLSASRVGFTTTQHCPSPGVGCGVVFFLDEKHWTVMMEDILSCWVAEAGCYRHATAPQTFAVAMLSDAVQAYSVSDNTMVEDKTRESNPSNGALKDTTPS
jgi:hypothetical protein